MRASFLTRGESGFAAALDVRVKLALCCLGSPAAIILSSPLSLGLLALLSGCLAAAAAKPSTLIRVYLFSTVLMLFTLAFTAALSLIVPGLMRWDAYSLSVPYLRMLVSINLLLALALSTPVHVLLTRLMGTRLPGWALIPLSVAVRFIPTFINDCAQIRDAARLRPGRGLARLWRGFVVPLVFRVLYSADDLAMAAELKGIDAAGRMRGDELPGLSRRDCAMLALALLALALAGVLQKFGPDFKPLPM
ncbi:MAG: energy-coupling factor transporter transmembrane protein EcfT [Desulfovibrio sp.]|jgi:energy-coupling factor transport system permease protein|nr:energy-coupling factor transporter transmembrane protein EcfT [Desulfovibrio sp.]